MKLAWKNKSLAEICKIVFGKPFDSSLFNSAKNGTPLVRIRDVARGYSETYTTESFEEEYRVSNGDLLIGMDGEFRISEWTGNMACLNQRVCKLIPHADIVLGHFLLYGLNTHLKSIEDKKGFSTVKHLSAKDLKSITISLPALPEQERIVGILDAAFKKIDAVQRNAERNLANAKELFQRVLDEEMTNFTSFLHLRDVCSITTGKLNANAAVAGGKYPFFTCSKEISQIDSYSFDCEALLLAGNNASGDFNVKYYNGKFNAYQRTYVIHNFQNYRPELIFHILVHNLASLKNVSLGVNTRYLKIGMIESIILPKIPLEQQMVLAKRLSRVCDLCNSYCEKYSAIKRNCLYVKQQILNRAFNGEL